MLLALVPAAAVVAILLVRARRRRRWLDAYSTSELEVAWFARTLLPQLERAGSTDQIAAGWAAAAGRVAAVDDALTELETTAPGDRERDRSRVLREAVAAARGQVQRLVSPDGPVVLPQDLEQVRAGLEAALARLGVAPPT